jgi:hemolysin activation/secretion protein
MELRIFKQDSSFITTDQQARATYQINPTSDSYIGYKSYESSNLLNDAIAGSPIEDFKSQFLLLGAGYKKLQRNSFFPIKTNVALNSEIGTRNLKDTKEDQVKILTTVNHIFNLNLKNSIYVQNDTGILLSDSFLTNELLRFGGINSIRGFNENSIYATLLTVFNTEYRYQFNQGLYLNSIIDIGYFENDAISLKEKLYSYGIGLGLQTKAGLLKLNIANGNTENQSFNFSNTKIHLVLSSRF